MQMGFRTRIFLLFIATVLLFQRGPAAAAEGGGSIWEADYFPDVPLITHKGKKVRFFTDLIKDKVVAINFIYTNCPDACALETARLREVQQGVREGGEDREKETAAIPTT